MTGTYAPPGYMEAPQGEPLIEDSSSHLNFDEHAPRQGQLRWSSGICACCDDVPICCLGCWCPCVLFGQNVEMLEGKPWIGPCLMHFLLWGVVTGLCCALTEGTIVGVLGSCVPCYVCSYRKALRTRYNLEDAPCGDFLTHLCCHMCANCQEHRELTERTSTGVGLPVVVPPPLQVMGAPPSVMKHTHPQGHVDPF
ncbi:hypothetical protein MPTK1_3g23350 [Marchantia polymorpha subsp. ruderalis]|uniref:Uncharacterized protein n=2 Tax=Marchantia polymorpha TaxID=3197 RepID=A0A176VYM7_MARPO|nr:hypothetical protein AXG93_4620s1090 [Marchantia polymorpha subsp. ruderalis]PTQ43613.1 hypothetical protein MARPO_0024s0111 [Marchantia polymorpha]BBN06715.1 hypothetical protein Mp_3g23350 [Marchantia polymorpha subsp. ruderalis]|eukprot:PTQ43613.1 hypothetical protein MARPO_0024s0111 [Marchantia polymorpha]